MCIVCDSDEGNSGTYNRNASGSESSVTGSVSGSDSVVVVLLVTYEVMVLVVPAAVALTSSATNLNTVIQEHAVHSLSKPLLASETEREVRHAPTDSSVRQVILWV